MNRSEKIIELSIQKYNSSKESISKITKEMSDIDKRITRRMVDGALSGKVTEYKGYLVDAFEKYYEIQLEEIYGDQINQIKKNIEDEIRKKVGEENIEGMLSPANLVTFKEGAGEALFKEIIHKIGHDQKAIQALSEYVESDKKWKKDAAQQLAEILKFLKEGK